MEAMAICLGLREKKSPGENRLERASETFRYLVVSDRLGPGKIKIERVVHCCQYPRAREL